MRSLYLVVLGIAALTLPAAAATETWQIDPAHSAAQFTVRHMMISNVKGEFGKMAGSVQYDPADASKTAIEATIDAATINTREERRDTHLKSADFFDVAKYPTVTFKSKRVESAGPGKLKLVGDLTMHGVTREVILDVVGPTQTMKDQQGNLHMGASASTTINRKDWGLTWNRALDGGGVLVGDEVAIAIDVELIRRIARPAGE